MLPQKLSYSYYIVTSSSLLPLEMHVCILSASLIIHPLQEGVEPELSRRFALFRSLRCHT